MNNDRLKIKSMKLYNNVERIFNELREIGKSTSDTLLSEDLAKFDQLHYHGTDAIDNLWPSVATPANSLPLTCI